MPHSIIVASDRLSGCPPSQRAAQAAHGVSSQKPESDRMRWGGAQALSFVGRGCRLSTIVSTTGGENSRSVTGQDPPSDALRNEAIYPGQSGPPPVVFQCCWVSASASGQRGSIARVDNLCDASYQDVLGCRRHPLPPAPLVFSDERSGVAGNWAPAAKRGDERSC